MEKQQELQNLLNEMEKQRLEDTKLLQRLENSIRKLKCENFQESANQAIPSTSIGNPCMECSEHSLNRFPNVPNVVATSSVPNISERYGLRFGDIAQSFKKFNGECHMSVRAWLKHFNEQSQVFRLSPFEKLIYAKRLMDGTAALFVEYESKATDFERLAEELIDEYGKNINSALTHQKLQERRKKKNETVIEYLYGMLSIASSSEIDIAAIITYNKTYNRL